MTNRDYMSTNAAPRFPVAVVMEWRSAQVGRWTSERWEAIAVVARQSVSDDGLMRTRINSETARVQYLWTGFVLELFKDSAESYWYNLLGQTPSLFVVCHPDEDEDESEGLVPILVTASQDEAAAHLEADEEVYSVPMPRVIYEWVERYVVENYVPQEKKKRRRKNWVDESGHGKASKETFRPGA